MAWVFRYPRAMASAKEDILEKELALEARTRSLMRKLYPRLLTDTMTKRMIDYSSIYPD